ncbi:Hsp20/alpha crystallin family protein [Sulfuricurvum sp. IAE1]|uniref:Hsp20/alpha crystallin family protein n=1 Tax=Sulfuricurvum sp. IAE1 TaxID=2546102 RepID=UPI001404C527|nr:Hsp20/alpha crystallin family protein [Sulfuricurvum sp. IAE1]
MHVSKRLVIALSAVPLLLAAAPSKPCNSGCPFWGIEEMENFFNRPYPRTNAFASTMKEDEKRYLITIDLPGIDKKEITVETSGNRLSVSGEHKEENADKESSKRSYAQFQQSYLLPPDANLDAIEASSKNGVLTITVPKTGKKVSKKIEVK